MSELKPCPFCGNTVGYVTSLYGYRVVCDVCDIQGPRGISADLARAEWNTRAESPELTAALTPAEKGPTCPKCEHRLIPLAGDFGFECSDGACDYSQPDSAQRPKMPDSEHLKPFRLHWEFIPYKAGLPRDAWGWIPVPDAEPIAVKDAQVVRCPECVQFACTDRGKTMPKEECGGRDFQASPVKPVVRYYAMTEPECYTWYRKSVGKYPMVECFRADGACWVYGTCQPNEAAVSHEITEGAYKAAYESTRKPAKPAIEPLDDRDYGRAEMQTKINELVTLVTGLIARVNALEGGGK